MTAKSFLVFCILPMCQILLGQSDSIYIKEIIITDSQLHHFSNSQSVLKIVDSVLIKNQPSLTSLLNYNTSIYFKENGVGMVSSPSFRGTTAQQTAVIWNGININSQFNGQTDFNTISGLEFNSVTVRAGGGSVIYGSSAIGGSIHLDNEMVFVKALDQRLSVRYGSFNTFHGDYRINFSNNRFFTQVSLLRNASDNDYKFLETNRKNKNGQFVNNGFNTHFGFKLNSQNIIKFYSRYFLSKRHFSLMNPTDTPTKYDDEISYNLMEWESVFGYFESKLKFAYLDESYNYFADIDQKASNYGHAKTLISKYDVAYSPNQTLRLNAIVDYTQTSGDGSDIGENTRKIATAAFLVKYQVLKNLLYEVSFRKETSNDYDSPLLYASGISYKPLSFYTLKVNISRNFRMPTFNDLYWIDSEHSDLLPESSHQFEIGHLFTFNNIKFSLTGYLIKIQDMIQWVPGIDTFWAPQNLTTVITYGGEATVNYNKSIDKHKFDLSGTYAYTTSENEKTGFQLIYVPFHKSTVAIAYNYKRFSADYQHLFVGGVFTRSDNNPRYNVMPYSVSNFALQYSFGKNNFLSTGFQLRNIFNANYETVAGRPNPGRHINTYLNLNF